MYFLSYSVQETVPSRLWLSGHSKIPIKTQWRTQIQRRTKDKMFGPRGKGTTDEGDRVYRLVGKANVWQISSYECWVIAVSVRELCHAAHSHSCERLLTSNSAYLSDSLRKAVLQQVCQQRHRACDQVGSPWVQRNSCKTIDRVWQVTCSLYSLVTLAKHQFGNYVIQSLLHQISASSKARLRNKLRDNSQEISKSQYGRHVLLQAEKHKWLYIEVQGIEN